MTDKAPSSTLHRTHSTAASPLLVEDWRRPCASSTPQHTSSQELPATRVSARIRISLPSPLLQQLEHLDVALFNSGLGRVPETIIQRIEISSEPGGRGGRGSGGTSKDLRTLSTAQQAYASRCLQRDTADSSREKGRRGKGREALCAR